MIILRNTEGEEGGGGGQQQASAGQAALGGSAQQSNEGQQQAAQGGQAQQQQAGNTQTGNTTSLSPEQIQQIVTGAVTPLLQQQRQQQPQQQRQYTQDDFNKAFNVWNPDESFVSQFVPNWQELDANARASHPLTKAFPTMRDALVRQAVTLAAYQIQEEMGKIRGEFGPILEHVNEARREKMKSDFFTEFPHLKPYEAIAMAVGQQIQSNAAASGQQLSVKDAFKLVADETLKTLKAAGIDPATAQAAGQGAAQQNNGQHRMNALSNGGQGGAGGSAGGKPAAKSAGMRALSS